MGPDVVEAVSQLDPAVSWRRLRCAVLCSLGGPLLAHAQPARIAGVPGGILNFWLHAHNLQLPLLAHSQVHHVRLERACSAHRVIVLVRAAGRAVRSTPRTSAAPSQPANAPLHSAAVRLPLLAQGVPSVARAAAVTGIHDPAFLEALADAAIKSMSHLSAADICSMVESFSGGPRLSWEVV